MRLVVLALAFAAGWHLSSLSRPAPALSPAPVPSATHQNFSLLASSSLSVADAEAAVLAAIHMPDRFKRERLLKNLAARLDAKSLHAIFAHFTQKPYNWRDGDALSILMDKWVKLDPRSAFAWAQSLPSYTYNSYLRLAFYGWIDLDPVAALAALASSPPSNLGYEMIPGFDKLAHEDPQALLAVLQALPPGRADIRRISSSAYDAIVRAMMEKDPASAIAFAANLPRDLRQNAQYNIADAWAEKDSTAALAWAQSLPAGSDRRDAVRTVIQNLSGRDPAAAAALALQLPVGNSNSYPGSADRDGVLNAVAQTWAQQDPAAALAWADQNLTGQNFDRATQTALKQMAANDPVATAACLANLSTDPAVVNQAIPDLASTWANQDTAAALAWAQSLPATNADVRQSALGNILHTMADADPVSTAAYIANLSTDPAFGNLANQLIDNWGNSDPVAAFAWAQSLPPGDAQNAAIVAAAGQFGNADPVAAWNAAAQLSGPVRDQALGKVINAWVDQQPTQAAAALANLPSGDDLNTATTEVASSWLRQDPAAAAQWIGTLPAGTARDGAVAKLVDNLHDSDPAAAMTWATSIGDESMRNNQVVNLANQWSGRNPAAAATAAQNALSLSGLTADQQSTLRKIAAKTK